MKPNIQSYFFIVYVILIAGSSAKVCADHSNIPKQTTIAIEHIDPTVFFVNQKDRILQRVEVSIDNSVAPIPLFLNVKSETGQRTETLGNVPKGKHTFDVLVPYQPEFIRAEFLLQSDDKLWDKQSADWQPQLWEIHLVPISHHDYGYVGTIEETLEAYDGFYDKVLAFCEQTQNWPEDSQYRYTVEQAWSLVHYLQSRPEPIQKQLAKYIQQGRIEIPAFLGNEITAFCGHEEIIRLMYPSFKCARRFNAPIEVGSITDIPGLSWSIPTILAGADVKYFFAGMPPYFNRSDSNHDFWDADRILRNGQPDAFYWQGPDGKSVLTYYQGGYGCWRDEHTYDAFMEKLPPKLKAMEQQGNRLRVYRIALSGCVDNTPPELYPSEVVRQWNANWVWPKLIVSTNSMFFKRLEKQAKHLRTFSGELPHTDYVVGILSRAHETGLSRITHDRLNTAEKFSAIASLVSDFNYPAEKIDNAWYDLLMYDEHTWGLPSEYIGTARMEWNWSDKAHHVYRARGIADTLLLGPRKKKNIFQYIATQLQCEDDQKHIVVFNPLSTERSDIVRVSPFKRIKNFDLIDEQTGHPLPWQLYEYNDPRSPLPLAPQRTAIQNYRSSQRYDLVFHADQVPPMGYKTYRIVPREKSLEYPSSILITERGLENRFYKLTLNPQTGAIDSIIDKQLNRELVDPAAPHNVNQFIARNVKDNRQYPVSHVTISPGQAGPVYSSLVVHARTNGCPQITQEIILYENIKRIDFNNRVLFQYAPLMQYYVAFPFNIDPPHFSYEGTDSVIRPFIDQFPGSNTHYYSIQHWAKVTDNTFSITLSPVESHLMEFGGLWNSYVSGAHHGVEWVGFGEGFMNPDDIKKGYMYSYVLENNFRTNFHPVQQTDTLFRYSLTSDDVQGGNLRSREFGWSVGNPLIAQMVQGKQQGTLGTHMSFCSVDQPNVMVLALKRAEDGRGIIVRLIETEGQSATATVALPVFEIKHACLTNLVEDNRAKISFTEHTFTTDITPFSITTIRCR